MSQREFRDAYPVAWEFHRNTMRWSFERIDIDELAEYQEPGKEYGRLPQHPLPAARPLGSLLGDCLRDRISCRRFSRDALSLIDLGTMLHAAYGMHGALDVGNLEFLERPVPSAGSLYPLEIFVLATNTEGLEQGVYHYAPQFHALEQVAAMALSRAFLTYLFMGQYYAAAAGAVIVLVAVVGRSLKKYGDRGYRYVLLESGHAAQNLNLAAASLGLGALNLGGFFDQELAALLGLSLEAEIPLYAIATGSIGGSGRADIRMPSGDDGGSEDRHDAQHAEHDRGEAGGDRELGSGGAQDRQDGEQEYQRMTQQRGLGAERP
ncbi:MAG TPA: SagB/ThcOx family dehydrogenase [Actinomycetota bacterium]|jgi:SagB-type dehydrogenase family enzyme